jgi:hypothetical protein
MAKKTAKPKTKKAAKPKPTELAPGEYIIPKAKEGCRVTVAE